MFGYVFVLGFVCALAVGKDAPPKYMEAMDAILRARDALLDNVVSMSSGIPLMNDPRRHYAEIVNNVCRQADNLVCGKKNYDKEYLLVLNRTSAIGFINPRMVVDHVVYLLDSVMEKIEKMRSLIVNQCKSVNAEECNQVVDEVVRSDPDRYKEVAKMLFSAARTAGAFNKVEPTFAVMARRYVAVKYSVEGQLVLKELILSVVNMKRDVLDYVC